MSKITDPMEPLPDPHAVGRSLEEECERLLREGFLYSGSEYLVGRVTAHLVERHNAGLADHEYHLVMPMPPVSIEELASIAGECGYEIRITFTPPQVEEAPLDLEDADAQILANVIKRLGKGNVLLSDQGVLLRYREHGQETSLLVGYRNKLRESDRLTDALRTAMRYALKVTPL